MDIINQIFIAALLTTLTGAIVFYVLEHFIKKLMEIRPDFAYTAVRCVCILFVVPIGFVLLKLTLKSKYVQADAIFNRSFALTGYLRILVFLAALVWMGMVIKSVVKFVRGILPWFEIIRGNIPEDDDVAEEEFLRIKRNLKIYRYVRLRRNDLLQTPLTTGIIVPTVLLPYQKYSREQLVIILYHELTHCKNHDVFFKICCIYIRLVTQMKKQACKLGEYVDELSECNCDAKASEAMLKEYSRKKYFNIILDIADAAKTGGRYPTAMLCEGQTCLERRINYMVLLDKTKKTTKVAAFGLSLMCMLLGVTTTYAAGVPLASFQEWLYVQTEHTAMETEELHELEEQYIPSYEDNSYDSVIYEDAQVMSAMPRLGVNEIASFDWKIESGVRYISSAFSVKSGQNISVSASTAPSTSTYWLGIMDSAGNVRYVSGTGSFGYTFPIDKSSSYRIIVQNKSSVTMQSMGSYYFY